MLAQIAFLFGTVLLPIFLLIAAGAVLQRAHPFDPRSLATLQIYLFVPAFLFDRMLNANLTWEQIGKIAVAILAVKLILGAVVYGVLVWRKVPRETLSTVLLASVIFNAGNFGIPVAERAFGTAGGEVEAVVVMVANLSLWGIGYALSAALTGGGVKGLIAYFKLPMVYTMALALVLRATHWTLPEPVEYSVHQLSAGLVPLSLITLGAQLARQARWPRWRLVAPVIALKLIGLPLVAFVLVRAYGLWPWPGAQLVVAAAGPTAVNSMLLAMEQKGDVELAADCVFWTTAFSAISVAVILGLVMAAGGHP